MKTIYGVPIAETGIEYNTSTGKVTLTAEDLADMVESQNDAAIVAPRLKLGHTDPRFNGEDGEPIMLDGEPAFGIANNLRLENEGNTVVCDYVGVPDWVADILPFVYPNRSVEGNFDVETVTGHKWRFVCTDVALLGVVWPGISTLDDLQAAVSDEGPEGVEVKAKGKPVDVSRLTLASVNLEDVRRNFYEEVATQETGRYWWWVRAVLLDPNELIVDDDDGGLYRIPFNISGDSIEFEDPISVKVQYVDAPEKVEAAVGKGVLAAVYNERPTTRQEVPVEGSSTSPGTGTAASAGSFDLSLLRTHLGLPEDATEEQINAKLQEMIDAGAPAGGTTSPEAESGDEPTGEEEPASEREPAGTTASTGAVLVDSETLSTLQRNAALGLQAYERQRVSDRDSFLAAAVQAGKFPPARLKHWTEAWDKDPEGIRAAIDSMPAGLIPVHAMGGAPPDEGGSSQPSYPPEWLPELRRQNQSSRVTQEA